MSGAGQTKGNMQDNGGIMLVQKVSTFVHCNRILVRHEVKLQMGCV